MGKNTGLFLRSRREIRPRAEVGSFLILSLIALLILACGCITATGNSAASTAKIIIYERDAGHTATAYLDGKYLGIAPSVTIRNNPVSGPEPGNNGLTEVVRPGTYEIRIADPSCRNDMVRNVSVDAGDTMILYGYCV